MIFNGVKILSNEFDFSSDEISTTMDAKRELVVKLHLQNNKPSEILKKLNYLEINRIFIYRTIKRYNETGTFKIQKKTGRKPTIRVNNVIKIVRERIRRNPAQSGRNIAKSMKISHRSFRRILKHDPGLKTYKKQKIHGLTVAQKKARVKNVKACWRGTQVMK